MSKLIIACGWVLGWVAGQVAVAAAPMSNTGLTAPTSGVARIYPDTELVKAGQPNAVIVYSGVDPAPADAARQLGAALQSRLGVEFPAVADTTLCSNVMTRVPDAYRKQNLIVVGNLHNNRVVFPLYAIFLCGADCEYPGDDGYELRTISNPWGTGKNVLLIGASTPAGARAGVAAFLTNLPATRAENVTIPRLLEVKSGKAIKAKFDKITERLAKSQFQRPAQPFSYMSLLFITPAYNYHWTGDPRWAAIAREALNYFNETYTGLYPVGHYDAEAFFRAWDLVEEAPVFTDAERQTTSRHLLENAWGLWHISNTGGAGCLGNTHSTMMNMTQWTATRYLQRTFWDEPELLKELAGREAALRDYYRAALSGFSSEDGGNTTTDFALFLRWSAMEQEAAYLESGYVRQGLLFAATYYDPLGCEAGIGMYGEARPGAMRAKGGTGYWATSYAFRLGAFLFQDPEIAWLSNRFAEYSPVDIWGVMDLSRFGAGTYPPPPEVKVQPPLLADGLSIVPFDQRRYHLWNIGMPTRGVPVNQRMPVLERMYDKACFRTGYAAQDQYLLLQGLLFGSEDANTIARYTDQGQIWLTHNSSQIGPFIRNGLFISDGLNDRQVQSGCRLDAAGRFDELAMLSSTLMDFYESDWQRIIFWKPQGWFVVLDRAILARSGQYAVQSVWRLPPIAGVWKAAARQLTAVQGDKKLWIQAGEALPVSAQFESPAGGMPDIYENPFILREYKSGFYPARRAVDFQNLLTVTDATNTTDYAITRINDAATLVRGPTGEVWVAGAGGAATEALGLNADGGIYAWTTQAIYVAGVRMLRLDGENIMDAPRPITARIDLQTGSVSAGYDANQLRLAASTWKLPPQAVPVSGWTKEKARQIAATLAERLTQAGVVASGQSSVVSRQATATGPAPLTLRWESLAAGLYGKPPDGLTVKAMSPDIQGEACVLVDRIVPGRSGQVSWPGLQAQTVELAWAHTEPIAEIRINNGQAAPEKRMDLAQRRPQDREVGLVWSNDGFREDQRVQSKLVDKEIRMDPTYKDEVTASQYLRVPCEGVAAAGVRLTIPGSSNDYWHSGVGISEIEVLTTSRGPLGIDQLLVADLGSKNEPSIIVSTEERCLAVLGPDGKLRWQKTFAGRIPSVVVADIRGDGQKEIVCCSYDRQVYALAADGREIWKKSYGEVFGKGGSVAPNGTPFAVGFWEPRPGLRRVAVGQYAGKSALLDDSGQAVAYASHAGYTPRNYFGHADLNGDGVEELCLSSIKYVGAGTIYVIAVNREGRPVNTNQTYDTTGYTQVPGGTPFVAQFLKDRPGCAAVIAPGGVGVYNLKLAEQKYGGFNALWESGNRPLSAGLLHDLDGDGADELLAGGRDGFITVYATDGVVRRVALIGEDVKGILAFGTGEAIRYVVATPRGLRVYDQQWQLLGIHPDAYARLCVMDPARETFVAATDDARIQLWQLGRSGVWRLFSK